MNKPISNARNELVELNDEIARQEKVVEQIRDKKGTTSDEFRPAKMLLRRLRSESLPILKRVKLEKYQEFIAVITGNAEVMEALRNARIWGPLVGHRNTLEDIQGAFNTLGRVTETRKAIKAELGI